MRGRAVLAVTAAFLYVGGAAALTLLAFLVGGFKCDENCSDLAGAGWTERVDAWQWTAILVLGVAAFALAVAAVVAAAHAGNAVALAVWSLGGACALVAAELIHEAQGVGFVLLVATLAWLAVGLAAVRLYRRRARVSGGA